jgi:opacity protein-like surface antigen
MNKPIHFTVAAIALFGVSAFAGEKTIAPGKTVVPPPEPNFGTGFYVALQAGINAYQDFGGTRRFEAGGRSIAVEPRENVGFVGGLKLGYVFGRDRIRPTIEADMFYNGVRADIDTRVNGKNADFNVDGNLHSGAFLANLLLRFDCGRFQPYFGGGVGGWVAEANDVDVTIKGRNFDLGDSGSSSGFAWQLVAGADYYWTEKWSIFLEYKFLNYENAGIAGDRIAQHIVVLGSRWHF